MILRRFISFFFISKENEERMELFQFFFSLSFQVLQFGSPLVEKYSSKLGDEGALSVLFFMLEQFELEC